MDAIELTGAITRTVSPLFDADLASVSDLSARRRASTIVADADAAYRAELITEYVAVRGDLAAELRLYADATKYDLAHPDEAPLFDELHAIELFGAQPVEGVAA
ncbi:hypothetical protein OHB04_02500 [Streptomyces sp. NBC_01775]|uniref:hypothetical protein n=1 Tax=Streptomyces sp. NBC_01775 TaxID=2975939 RepID=UPI002DD87FB0|nr:hypothetical protein [Streptomyces sp. NBC_01775]WSB74764.1 hypothetical protein OHB04_02500 [Streptomyces sp. NBC_01775]